MNKYCVLATLNITVQQTLNGYSVCAGEEQHKLLFLFQGQLVEDLPEHSYGGVRAGVSSLVVAAILQHLPVVVLVPYRSTHTLIQDLTCRPHLFCRRKYYLKNLYIIYFNTTVARPSQLELLTISSNQKISDSFVLV